MARTATGGRLPLGLAVVRGRSMLPTLRPGDRLLVRYGAAPRPGRVVVVRFPDGTVAVKRVVEWRDGGWWLEGDAGSGAAGAVDSWRWGSIPPADVLGVVVARLWPAPRVL